MGGDITWWVGFDIPEEMNRKEKREEDGWLKGAQFHGLALLVSVVCFTGVGV